MKTFIAMTSLLALFLTGCADPASETKSMEAPAPEAVTDMAPPGAAEDVAQAAAEMTAESMPAESAATGPVDFSGTWVLNTDRGENLGMMKAVKETIVATQTADRVTFDMTDKFAGVTTKRIVIYDLNGETMQNKAAMGAASETVSQWDGDKLVTTWTAEGAISGTKTERTETRWLIDDGQTLSVSMARGGNPAILFVYEKAE